MSQGRKGPKGEYRKWDIIEEVKILKYMKQLKDQGIEVEKPTAPKYYEKLLSNVEIPNASISQVKNKVKNLKASYSAANQWANQTGQGVDTGTVEGYKRKLCPHFDALDEIYGDRVSFTLPFYRDTLERSQESEKNGSNENVRKSQTIVFVGECSTDVTGNSSSSMNTIGDNNETIVISGEIGAIQEISRNSGDCNNSENGLFASSSRSITDQSTVRKATVGRSIVDNNNIATRVSIPKVSQNTSRNFNRRTAPDEGCDLNMFVSYGGCADVDDDTSGQSEKISRFKKRLSLEPKSSKGFSTKPKPVGSNAASVMSTVMSQKADALADKNEIERKKVQDELFFKNQHLEINLEMIKETNKIEEKRVEQNLLLKKAKIELNAEKFKHQREIEKGAMEVQHAAIEIKRAKIESKEKLAILELEKQERLEMYKMKLEYEKMNKKAPKS